MNEPVDTAVPFPTVLPHLHSPWTSEVCPLETQTSDGFWNINYVIVDLSDLPKHYHVSLTSFCSSRLPWGRRWVEGAPWWQQRRTVEKAGGGRRTKGEVMTNFINLLLISYLHWGFLLIVLCIAVPMLVFSSSRHRAIPGNQRKFKSKLKHSTSHQAVSTYVSILSLLFPLSLAGLLLPFPVQVPVFQPAYFYRREGVRNSTIKHSRYKMSH